MSRHDAAGAALTVAFVYLVLLGGTSDGQMDAALRVINAGIAAVVIWLYARRIVRASADAIDVALILAVVCLAVTGAFSMFPRQSFDSVLGGLALAAGFQVSRSALAAPGTRSMLINAMRIASVVVIVLFAVVWLGQVVRWWAGTNWEVTPPLNFELGGNPWGHRHDVALLIAMLYPAWWVGRLSWSRSIVAVPLGLIAALVIIVDGSRIVWAACALATLSLVVIHVRNGRSVPRNVVVIVTAAALATLVALVVTGAAQSLLSRAASTSTLDWRLAMWGPLSADWVQHPLTGNGPGSFPWVLQLTGYFDTNSWAPRHPDSLIVQTLVEGGVLGLIAIGAVIATVLPRVLKAGHPAAAWALIAFAVACIGASPTDFVYIMVVVVAWAALALPVPAGMSGTPARRSRTLRAVTSSILVLIGGAYALTLAGAIAYETASNRVAAGDTSDSVDSFELALSLDPAMALYARQLGIARLLDGETEEAIVALGTASRLNPADDLTWRTLAMAQRDSAPRASEHAVERALELQRSDPANLLLAARLSPSIEETRDALAEAVQAWPTLIFSSAWPDALPRSVTTLQVVRAASQRWVADLPMPALRSDQGIWLAVLADDDAALESALMDAPLGTPLSSMLAASIQCENLGPTIKNAEPSELRTVTFWWLRIRNGQLHGSPDDLAVHMSAYMGSRVSATYAGTILNPLDAGGVNADGFGYRRRAIAWPAMLQLPSEFGGQMAWLFEPHESAEAAGLPLNCVAP